ncbi:MAG: tyrosine--tRNA ligase [Candidatus Methylacidiphilales bacterium]|nr:tyrosine--tRNA ligase [Candidatus Methylacidiphilales bacterium]
MTAEQQLDLLCQGVETIHSKPELLKKLQTGRPLRVKLGFDPTSPDLHLGHAVVLNKIRQFQDLGHTAVILVGDYTARIGDPTGRSKTRVPLDPAQIDANARTYTDQVFKILNPAQTEVRRNSEWFDKFTYADVLKLNGRITVAQLLAREDFRKRFESDQAISLTEFQYPLMQGHDSVEVKADVELGGNDQLFNNLVGRDQQKDAGQEPQVVMVLPILEGTDGVEKMSKSLGNYIGIAEAPSEMFGKAMSISDELMGRWYPVLLGHKLDPATHPMEAKKHLASSIVTRYHGEEAGKAARADFEQKFSKKDLSTADMPEITVSASPIWIVKLLQETGAVTSGGEARRLITQGGVKINGEKVADDKAQVTVEPGMILQSGKKFFARLKA